MTTSASAVRVRRLITRLVVEILAMRTQEEQLIIARRESGTYYGFVDYVRVNSETARA